VRRLSVLLALILCGCVQPQTDAVEIPISTPVTQVGWFQVANATMPRAEHAVGQIGSDVYIIAGMTNETDGVATAERYNVTTGEWTTLPDLPVATHHTTATGVGGVLIVAGGFDVSGPTGLTISDRAFQFDPKTDKWSELPRMAIPRAAHAAVAVDGKLYLVGGYTVALVGHTPQVSIYDPAVGVWTAGAPMPTPRDHLGAAAVGGVIYAFGGDLATHSNSADAVEAYDTATGVWLPKGKLPTVRGSMSAVAVGDKIWVMGGQDGMRTYDDVDEYTPATDTWTQLPPLLSPRHGFGSASWDDVVYVVEGGPEPGASFTGSIEAYDPHETVDDF
jgi:N-acetylneuraminic acid mutarotase